MLSRPTWRPLDLCNILFSSLRLKPIFSPFPCKYTIKKTTLSLFGGWRVEGLFNLSSDRTLQAKTDTSLRHKTLDYSILKYATKGCKWQPVSGLPPLSNFLKEGLQKEIVPTSHVSLLKTTCFRLLQFTDISDVNWNRSACLNLGQH